PAMRAPWPVNLVVSERRSPLVRRWSTRVRVPHMAQELKGPYMWRCVHCGKGWMSLKTGRRHLARKHYDCWSCSLELKLLIAMLEGRGYVVEGDPFRPADHS